MTTKFHERFGLHVGQEAARVKFMNRISNRIFFTNYGRQESILAEVANVLGIKYRTSFRRIDDMIGDDFLACLQAIEVVHLIGPTYFANPKQGQGVIDSEIRQTLSEAECDLGVTWKDGRFHKTGAAILDRVLVNDELRWLSSAQYERVRGPFEKGLRHLLESGKRPELLFDVVTDMYESVEALAKIITGREGKDLSANAELFLSKIKASSKYKMILKDYIDYANDFRHPPEEGVARKPISEHEAESFVYLTGLFIRMTIQSQVSA
jgi:hypothetical protein